MLSYDFEENNLTEVITLKIVSTNPGENNELSTEKTRLFVI